MNGKNGQFKKELEVFDGERDLVNIISSMNNMKSQIGVIEERLQKIKDIQIIAFEHANSQETTKLDHFRDTKLEENAYLMNRANNRFQSIEMDIVPKHTSRNSSNMIAEEVKAPSYNRECIINTAIAQIRNQTPRNESESFSQILDDIEHKNIKGNVESIYQIVENEMQDIEHENQHTLERRLERDELKGTNPSIKHPGYRINAQNQPPEISSSEYSMDHAYNLQQHSMQYPHSHTLT